MELYIRNTNNNCVCIYLLLSRKIINKKVNLLLLHAYYLTLSIEICKLASEFLKTV